MDVAVAGFGRMALLPFTSTRSSLVSSSPVTGHFPELSICFSISLGKLIGGALGAKEPLLIDVLRLRREDGLHCGLPADGADLDNRR